MFKFCITCGKYHDIGKVIVTDITPEDLANLIVIKMTEEEKVAFIVDWFTNEFLEDPEYFNLRLEEYNNDKRTKK